MALDSISTPTLVATLPVDAVPAALNGLEADASTAIEIVAAPGVGKAIFLTNIILGSDDADAHPHLQDEDDNVLFGPLLSTVEGGNLPKKFDRPLKLVSNKALELKAAAAGNVFVWCEYAIGSG